MICAESQHPHAARVRMTAPTGGARHKRGRGCCIGVLLCLSTSAMASQDTVPVQVPSGQPVDLVEVLLDDSPGETWVRFRFVAPQIARDAGGIDHDLAALDLDHLCTTIALPYLKAQALSPARVVISLSDRVVAFGQRDPEATQFFEAYKPAPTRCIWEEY